MTLTYLIGVAMLIAIPLSRSETTMRDLERLGAGAIVLATVAVLVAAL